MERYEKYKHLQTENIKQEAHRLLEKLPDKATWDDLMYQIYVRQTIEAGIKDSDEGRTVDVKELPKRFEGSGAMRSRLQLG